MKVFVTVGTHPQQFDRLIREIDKLAGEKMSKAGFFAQIGNCCFEPKRIEFKRFLTPKEIQQKIAESDVIVSHAGAGSIISALEQKRPLVVVPRLKEFKEHTNNHQRDLGIAMSEAGKVIAVLEIERLGDAIARAKGFKPAESSGPQGIIKAIEKFFEEKGIVA